MTDAGVTAVPPGGKDVEAFLASLLESEWGAPHLLVAQAVLSRPIVFAQPLSDEPRWHKHALNDIVTQYVHGNMKLIISLCEQR